MLPAPSSDRAQGRIRHEITAVQSAYPVFPTKKQTSGSAVPVSVMSDPPPSADLADAIFWQRCPRG
jgi:hypothetical protein